MMNETTMRTSAEWWDEVKRSPELMSDWLIKQYRGEVTAAERIMAVVGKFDLNSKTKRILTEIASQEEAHAEWVLELLQSRGITPSIDGAEERYWKTVLPAAVDFETTAAIGAHAERMRLERIRAIVHDQDGPQDVRATFQKILKQEEWHAIAFERIAGPAAMAKMEYTQEQGRAVLGLVV